MNAGWLRRLHLGARALGWIAGIAVIALAVLMALTQLLLPLLARHPEWVARELSAKLHRPVSFASLQGKWTGSGPLFVLRDVTVGVPPGGTGMPIEIPESELRLDFGGWLPSRHLLNLRTRGLQLDLSHDADGRWHVNGLGTGGGAEQQPGFGQLSVALWLDNLQLNITDAASGKHYSLIADQLRLSRQGSHIRVGALLRREGAPGELRGAGRFRDDGSSGRLWLSGQNLDLGALLAGVDLGGYAVQGGHGSVAAWLDWKQGKVVRNFSRLDLDGLRVIGANGRVEVPALHGEAELSRSVDGYELRWAGDDQGALAVWLHQPGTPQLAVQAAARDLQLAPLLPWLGLAPKLPPALATWLGAGHPHGKLDDVALAWTQAGGLQRLAADFSDLGIDPAGALPGVDGIRGTLRGDGEAVSLELPVQATTVRAPHSFRQPFVMSKLAGTLAFWHADGDWHLGLDPLDFEARATAASCAARSPCTTPAARHSWTCTPHCATATSPPPSCSGRSTPCRRPPWRGWIARWWAATSTTPRWWCAAISRTGRSSTTRAASRRAPRSATSRSATRPTGPRPPASMPSPASSTAACWCRRTAVPRWA